MRPPSAPADEAEVLEVRPLRDGGAEYYVHYPTCAPAPLWFS